MVKDGNNNGMGLGRRQVFLRLQEDRRSLGNLRGANHCRISELDLRDTWLRNRYLLWREENVSEVHFGICNVLHSAHSTTLITTKKPRASCSFQ